ncbi:MAG: hypothetical protein INR62_03790 [Rhodospirillales bacterium]|nr:hypothetical protein [Acetobacter sp.]
MKNAYATVERSPDSTLRLFSARLLGANPFLEVSCDNGIHWPISVRILAVMKRDKAASKGAGQRKRPGKTRKPGGLHILSDFPHRPASLEAILVSELVGIWMGRDVL